MQLWAHQANDLERLRAAYRAGSRRVVYVAPTGSGKTTTSAELMRLSVAKGRRVLFMVHLRTLVRQCSDRLSALSIPHGVIMAGFRRSDAPVQVCSRDTLIRTEFPPADLIIQDEAHHIGAKYDDIIARYPGAHILGLTATPIREDGRGLGASYDSLVCSLSPRQLTDQGFLVPARTFAPSAPDLRGVHTLGGDYQRGQLEEVCLKSRIIGDMPEHWKRYADGRRSVYYAVSIAHSKAIVDAFNAAGIRAAHLDAHSSDMER